MKSHLSVKNWEEFQQYKDRDPKWIKLHRDILTDYEFDQLTETQQLHLIKIWLLASKLDNQIPNDAIWIGRQIGAKSKVDVKQLVTSGFLVLYESVQECTETYLETETETYKEETDLYIAQFDAWWTAYDKKVDRKKCEAKWNRLEWKRLNITPEYLIKDTLNRHANCAKWAAGYQKNPLTYLNGECWNDELQRPARQQPTPADEYELRQRRTAAIISEINGGTVERDVSALSPAMVTYQR